MNKERKSLCDIGVHRWNYTYTSPDCFVNNIFVAIHYETRVCRKCYRVENRRNGFSILGGENFVGQTLDEPFRLVSKDNKEEINEEAEKDFLKKLRESADIAYGKNKIIT